MFASEIKNNNNYSVHLIEELERIFTLLPERRQQHLDSVTEFAFHLMTLRMKNDEKYPLVGSYNERQAHLAQLLIAYNLHDIGDIKIEIPHRMIDTDETSLRRKQIKAGDWISSADYDAEKFDAPIRGHIIAQAVRYGLDKNAEVPTHFLEIITQLGCKASTKQDRTQTELELLDLIALVAYQHHEYYDGKGWPRGVKLNPKESTMEVTFFDFMAGWYVNKVTRGANPRKIQASLPSQVLDAVDKRQEESLKRNPDGNPMYNPVWVEFMREHLDEVDVIVDRIFPDVAQKRNQFEEGI